MKSFLRYSLLFLCVIFTSIVTSNADVQTFIIAQLQSTVKFLGVTATTNTILTNSVDGADSNRICITAGGACDAIGTTARGGKLVLGGNEEGTIPGESYLETDQTLRIRSGSGNIQERSGSLIIANAAGTTNWTFDNSAGTLIGAGTATIGWTLQSAANQACTTTCVTPCVFGQNTANFAIVSCADATADVCICAGAS